VAAGGVHAFAPAVDQVGGRGLGRRADREQGGQPGREVAAGHVAVPAGAGPAGRQGQADQVAVAHLRGVDLLLQVQKTEVVLPALADHDLLRAHVGVRIKGAALPLDLPLQGAGVGRDPHRRAVGLRPEAGGRQVAEGLADAGAGLGQHHPRLAFPLAGLEGEGGLGRELGLRRPRLVQAQPMQKLLQPLLRGFGRNGPRPRLPWGRHVLPLRDAGPGVQSVAAVAVAHRARAQGLHRGGSPRPAGPGQGLGEGERLLPRGPGRLREFGQELSAAVAQGGGLLDHAFGLGQPQRLGQADRRRRAEPCGTDEGVKLQGVEDVRRTGRRLQSQPPRRQRRVDHHRRRPLRQLSRLGRPERPRPRRVRHGATRPRQHHQGRRKIEHGRNRVHSSR
jgi:hypothetical protein